MNENGISVWISGGYITLILEQIHSCRFKWFGSLPFCITEFRFPFWAWWSQTNPASPWNALSKPSSTRRMQLGGSHTVYCVISRCLSKSHGRLTRLSMRINLRVNLHVLNLVSAIWRGFHGRNPLAHREWCILHVCAAAAMALVDGIEEEEGNWA